MLLFAQIIGRNFDFYTNCASCANDTKFAKVIVREIAQILNKNKLTFRENPKFLIV